MGDRRPSRRLVGVALVVVALAVAGVGVAGADGLPSDSDTTLVIVEHDRSPAQPTVDDNVTVSATVRSVENGDDDYFVEGLTLYERPGARGDVLATNDSRVLMAPGSSVTKSVEAGFEEPGRKNLSIEVSMRTTGGEPITVVRPVTVTVRDSHPEVALRAGRIDRAGETGLELTVANGLEQPIRSLSLRLRGEGLTVADPERVRSVLAGGETATFAFDAADASAGPASVGLRLGYTGPDGERRVLRRSLDLSLRPVRNPANITLTDIGFTPTETGVEIRGSASNPGGANAQSVTIDVLDGDGVGPAPSESTFFVGAVPASDFSAFDVNAALDTNETVTIPLRVTFVADDVEVERTVRLRYDPPGEQQANPSGGDGGGGDGGGLPMVPIALLLVVLVGVVGWRRYR